jgi:hypothetical protein
MWVSLHTLHSFYRRSVNWIVDLESSQMADAYVASSGPPFYLAKAVALSDKTYMSADIGSPVLFLICAVTPEES